MSLTGWVLNSSAGLVVEVEGSAEELRRFEQRLETERPRASVVTVRDSTWLPAQGSTTFEIHHSDTDSAKSVNVLPDLATCDDCRAELVDSANRRFQYPFTNCTNCGPRYTIVVDIPYNRPNTTMREFVLCLALDVLRKIEVSQGSLQVGRVEESPRGTVVLQSRIGGNRVVDMLSGEQLPRIC